jgi:hypothetical protein
VSQFADERRWCKPNRVHWAERRNRSWSRQTTPSCTPHPSFTQLSTAVWLSHNRSTLRVIDVLLLGERRASHDLALPRSPTDATPLLL